MRSRHVTHELLRDTILLAALDMGEPTRKAIEDWCKDERGLEPLAVSDAIPALERDGYLERFTDGWVARYRLPK